MNCQKAIDVMGEAAEGRLQAALRADFEEHIAACTSCHTYFEHLRLTRKALRFLPPTRATNPRRGELIDRFTKEFDSPAGHQEQPERPGSRKRRA